MTVLNDVIINLAYLSRTSGNDVTELVHVPGHLVWQIAYEEDDGVGEEQFSEADLDESDVGASSRLSDVEGDDGIAADLTDERQDEVSEGDGHEGLHPEVAGVAVASPQLRDGQFREQVRPDEEPRAEQVEHDHCEHFVAQN